MIVRCVSVLLALASPIAFLSSAPARAAAEPARASQAEALALARAYSPSDLRRTAEITTLRRDFVNGLKREPSMAEMLSLYPTLGEALTEAMVSQIDVYIADFDERFFPRAADILAKSLTRDDILKLTAFYTSPLGRRSLESSAQKVDVSEVIDRALEGKDIDAGVARRQALKAGMATYSTLTEQERKTVLDLAQSPTGRRFMAASPQLMALQVELTNNPGTRFEEGSKAAMGAAFKRVTGVDPIGK